MSREAELIPFNEVTVAEEADALHEIIMKRDQGNQRMLHIRNLVPEIDRYADKLEARNNFIRSKKDHIEGRLSAFIIKSVKGDTVGVAKALTSQPERQKLPLPPMLVPEFMTKYYPGLDTKVYAWVDRYQFNSTSILNAAYRQIVQLAPVRVNNPGQVWTTEPSDTYNTGAHKAILNADLHPLGEGYYTDNESSRRARPPISQLYVYEEPLTVVTAEDTAAIKS